MRLRFGISNYIVIFCSIWIADLLLSVMMGQDMTSTHKTIQKRETVLDSHMASAFVFIFFDDISQILNLIIIQWIHSHKDVSFEMKWLQTIPCSEDFVQQFKIISASMCGNTISASICCYSLLTFRAHLFCC